jgi:hypothetical protein
VGQAAHRGLRSACHHRAPAWQTLNPASGCALLMLRIKQRSCERKKRAPSRVREGYPQGNRTQARGRDLGHNLNGYPMVLRLIGGARSELLAYTTRG